MTVLWIIVWLLKGTPALHAWNSWAVCLALCIFLDVMGGCSK